MMNFDYEALREDLINYYGTAMMYNPIAVIDLERVRKLNNQELLEIAKKNKFDLNSYIIKVKTWKK